MGNSNLLIKSNLFILFYSITSHTQCLTPIQEQTLSSVKVLLQASSKASMILLLNPNQHQV